MSLKNELSQLLDPKKNDLAGVIGLTETILEVSGRPGYVWVRLLDNPSEVIQAHNSKVSIVYNLPVFLRYDGLKYEVVEVDRNRYSNWGSDAAFVPNHGGQHSAMRWGGGGGDIVWVDSQQFLPLLVLPYGTTGSNTVSVSPYVFRNSEGHWIYTGNTGTIVPPSPSATGSIINLVMLRDSDGAIYLKTGSVFAGTVNSVADFVSHLPVYTDSKNDIIAGAVMMTTTGTNILWENILDVRQFLNRSSAPTGSNYIEAIEIQEDGIDKGDITKINFGNNYTVSVSGSVGLVGMDTTLDQINTIQFNTAFTGTFIEGELGWDIEDGCLVYGMPGGNVHNSIGQEIYIPRRVKNTTSTGMYNGQLVYITGGDGTNAYVAPARADAEVTSATTIAMLTEDIAAGQKGWATTYGLVRHLNTNAYAPGTVVYLSPYVDGGFTDVKPTAPNHLVSVGTVFRQHATEGSILVSINNGYELSELHDVYVSGTVAGQVLTYNGTIWTPQTPATSYYPYYELLFPSGTNTHFSLSARTETIQVSKNGLIQSPINVSLDSDGMGFTLNISDGIVETDEIIAMYPVDKELLLVDLNGDIVLDMNNNPIIA